MAANSGCFLNTVASKSLTTNPFHSSTGCIKASFRPIEGTIGVEDASLRSAPPLASLRSAPVPPLNVPRVAVSLGPDVPPTGLRNALKFPVEEWNNLVVNDFEATVFRKHPELAAVKQSLYDSGAVYAAMSGSGSAIFALYRK
ncbi:MAG: hypothetical protein II406_05735 [Bacteroidales bacterium]|nr:hypothetical protein [Bacteroidales bacterium]